MADFEITEKEWKALVARLDKAEDALKSLPIVKKDITLLKKAVDEAQAAALAAAQADGDSSGVDEEIIRRVNKVYAKLFPRP